MSCTASHLGLDEHNDGETTICSIPVRMKGPEEIIPIDLDLSNDHRTALTRIIKVIPSLIIPLPSSLLFLGYPNEISRTLIILGFLSLTPISLFSSTPFFLAFSLIKYN